MRKRVLSLWLSVCMVLTLLPVSAMAEEANTPIGKGGEIIAFAPLAETEKSVEVGTPIENLELPRKLTATVRTEVPADSGTEEEPVQDSGKPEENVTSVVPTVATTTSVIKESENDQQEAPAPEWEESTVDIPVTWSSDPEYNGNENGRYVFTPVIEGYTVSADLPEITVAVGAQPLMMALRGGAPVSRGDFLVTVDEDGVAPTFDSGVLTFGTAGEYTVSMAADKTSTTNRIVVSAADVTLNLDGVVIVAPDGTMSVGADAMTANNTVLNIIADSSFTGGIGGPVDPANACNGGSGISGNITVTGTAELTATGGIGGAAAMGTTGVGGAGISGNVTATDSAVLTAVGGMGTSGAGGGGIRGNVTATDNATLTVVGGEYHGIGLPYGGNGIGGNLTVTGYATVSSTGGAARSTPGRALTGTLTAVDFIIKGGYNDIMDDITVGSTELNYYRYITVKLATVFDFCNGEPTVGVKPGSNPTWNETSYTFAGWYTAQNGEGTKLTGAGDGGITYYAKWTYNGHTVRTTALDLTDINESKLYGSTQSGNIYTNAAEGWTWYADETMVDGETYAAKTLILSGMTVNTAASAALTVSGGTTVALADDSTSTVRSGDTSSASEDVFTYGIYGKGVLNIKGSGVLNSRAGTAAYTSSENEHEGSSYGIYSSGALNISSGTVNAYGGSGVPTGADNKSYGICSDSTLEISGGSITGNGGSGKVQSLGIASNSNMEIKGGTVTGKGGSDGAYQSIGFLTNENLSITGGTVSGTGDALASTGDTVSVGLAANGTVAITGGNVTAKSGSAVSSMAIFSGASLTVGSTEKPAAIANATNGSSAITTSNGPINPGVLYMSGSDAVVISFATYTISGTIKGSDTSAGIPANLQLKNSSGNVDSVVTAAANGSYSITGVPAGSYTIAVSYTGYENGTITEVTVSNANITGQDLALTKSSTELTDAQKLAAAEAAIMAAINRMSFSNSTTAADIVSVAQAASLYGVTVAWDSANGFAKTQATTSAAGSIRGILNVALNHESGGITIDTTIVKLSTGGDNGGGSNTPSNPADTKPTEPVTGSTENKATVDGKGNASVSLTDKNITDAIADAKAEATKKGVNTGDITAVIHVSTGGKNATTMTVNLPKTTQEQVIGNKIASVELVIDRPDLTLGINLAAVTEINRQAKADVQLSAIRMDNAKLTGGAKAAIGSRPVYDLKATYGNGKSVTDFGKGSVSVEIPYTLQKGEVAGNIYAVYVDANGRVTYLTDSSYDAKRGKGYSIMPWFPCYP